MNYAANFHEPPVLSYVVNIAARYHMSDSNRLKDSLKEELAKNVCNDEVTTNTTSVIVIIIIVIIINIKDDTKDYLTNKKILC